MQYPDPASMVELIAVLLPWAAATTGTKAAAFDPYKLVLGDLPVSISLRVLQGQVSQNLVLHAATQLRGATQKKLRRRRPVANLQIVAK